MVSGSKRVFISHTKQEAPAALLLKSWINSNLSPAVTAFVSESDIHAGKQWLGVIEEALREADLVVTLCSPKSIRKAWVVFESGGAWGRNIPLLPICHSGMSPAELPSPFGAFQGVDVCDKDFAKKFLEGLLRSLNIPEPAATDTKLLQSEILAAISEARKHADRFDLFVSAPMSAIPMSFANFRKSFQVVLDALSGAPELSSYYFAGKTFGKTIHFDAALVGSRKDFAALANSDRFLMVLPKRLSSGVLVEAGFALALGIPSVFYVRDKKHLPYALQDVGQFADSIFVQEYSSLRALALKIQNNGTQLWPTQWGRTYV